MQNWYEKNIEPEVRSVVKLLRDNGVNTECSCGHKMYVQCGYRHEGFLQEVDYLLFQAGYSNYDIDAHIIREDGHLRHFINIQLRDKNG